MELKDFLLSLLVIYLAARVLGELAVRVGQAAVLGELLAGILIGKNGLGWVDETETLSLLGQIGVMLLLFEIGLESDLGSFLKVGWSAATVAVIGVLAPFVLGYWLCLALGLSPRQAIFIGGTLTATSVAVSARVLSDLAKLRTPEGNIILGAAVLDDILGLVILSTIIGVATAGTMSWLEAGRTAFLALLVLTIAVAVGIRYAHLFSRLVNRMHTRGSLLIAALSLALALGYATEFMGLAAVIGAFAAGLILARSEHHIRVEFAIKPVADIFVPIFFVLIGAAVNVRFLNPVDHRNWSVLLLAGSLLLVALIGKLMAGLGAIGPRINRWAVGVGMLPRGEVGMIFASMGVTHHVLDDAQYGAILMVVVLTTLVSPTLLKWAFRQSEEDKPSHVKADHY
jgi:Kef-type K+ transport system membrane component KefB